MHCVIYVTTIHMWRDNSETGYREQSFSIIRENHRQRSFPRCLSIGEAQTAQWLPQIQIEPRFRRAVAQSAPRGVSQRMEGQGRQSAPYISARSFPGLPRPHNWVRSSSMVTSPRITSCRISDGLGSGNDSCENGNHGIYLH